MVIDSEFCYKAISFNAIGNQRERLKIQFLFCQCNKHLRCFGKRPADKIENGKYSADG
jgi:hypothetical protein